MCAMANEAEVLRCGYRTGYFTKADIARWADRQIEAIEEPRSELLDLSMIRQTHPLDVMKLLQSVGAGGPADTIEMELGFIGLLREERRVSPELAVRGMLTLAHEPGTTADQCSEIYRLDDACDCAIAGTYGSINEVEQELDSFVSPYARKLAERYPQLIPSVKVDKAEQSLAAESR
jgi:hypothetical protein